MDTKMMMEILAAIILPPAFIIASCITIFILKNRDKRVEGLDLSSNTSEVDIDCRNHN
jgi:hypothetical protein